MGATTYTDLRQNLAEVWDRVEDSQEPVVVSRKGHQDMVILPAAELEGLRETAHLLRSPKNARRLLEALSRALAGATAHVNPDGLRERLKIEK